MNNVSLLGLRITEIWREVVEHLNNLELERDAAVNDRVGHADAKSTSKSNPS